MNEQRSAQPDRTQGTRRVESVLVCAAQCGDNQATHELVRRYHSLVMRCARRYFLVGADREDVTQEGFLGLSKAIRDYNPNKQSSFRSFADLCVTRQIISAVKTATRHKHAPLNAYISLTAPAFDSERGERLLSDVVRADELRDPADIVIDEWTAVSIRDSVAQALSPFEQEVLGMYAEGCSYEQTALRLGRHVKAVDNALQRAKRKLESRIRAGDGS